MTFPAPLAAPALNRYALYKSGTATLVTWLLSTAATCGFGDPKNPPKNPVPVSRLLRCARAISDRTPAAHIPANIIETAVDVIRGRELYVELYAKIGEQDASHQHFIDQLWNVVMVLKDARKRFKNEKPKKAEIRNSSGDSRTSAESALPADRDSAANMFTHLTVESPPAKPFSTPEKPTAAKSYPILPTLAMTLKEERRMALVCYLEDMAELRKYIKQLWEAYVDGDLSLDVVGTTTELAFGCMRRAEEDLQVVFEKSGGASDRMNQFWLLSLGFMQDMKVEEVPTAYREELLCTDAGQLANIAKRECILLTESKSNNQATFSQAGVDFSKWGRFGSNLMRILPDLVRVANPMDEFTSDFCPSSGLYESRIFTTMMIQSYMDIYHTIGDPALVVHNALDAAYNRGSKMVEHYRRVRAKVRNPLAPGAIGMLEQRLSETGTFLKALRMSDIDRSSYTNSEARIFQTLPVGAIENLKYLKWAISMTSTSIANDGWIVISMAYLYRASQHYGFLSEKWEDLEWLIALQSKSRPYVIEVAEHADEEAFCRHYRMAFGMGMGAIDDRKVNQCMQKMRRVESLLEYPARMELESQSQDRLGCERGEMQEVVLRKMTSDRFFGKGQKNSKQENKKRFTNIELLETYKQSFTTDEPEYNMDFLGLWSDMAELMKSMNDFLYMRLMREETDPILCLDAQVAKPLLEEAAYFKKNGMPMIRTQIAIGANMIEKHIRAKGGFFLRETLGMSSGHIRKREYKASCAGRTRCEN